MNALDLQGQRRSWRQKNEPGGSRTTSRIIMTIVATALLVLFLCIIFWPQPDRQLKAFLIHARPDARSYDTHVIMPPMYGVTATSQIKSRFKRPDNDQVSSEDEVTATSESPLSLQPIDEITGTAKVVQRQIDSKIQSALKDKDDTVMLIFRGYLLAGENGPAIACSDFGPADNASDSPKGLLALNDVFQKLTENASKSAARLVVLDIEPLAGLPRFGQYDDDVFKSLEESVKQYSKQLWVLVTRGPLQNVGWDPKSNMPISTQTLLDGLDGGANRLEDNDYEIDLRELVSYIADRYRQLGPDPPQPLLLQGGLGRIDSNKKVARIRIVRAPEIDESELEPEPEQVEPEPADRDENIQTGRASHYNEPYNEPLNVTPVAFQTGENKKANADEPQPGEPGDNAKPDGDAVSTPESTGESDGDNDEQPPSEENAIAAKPGPESFWDVRDRMESLNYKQLHPIAVAPDRWKRLVQFVLHAEIESMDPKVDKSRQQDLTLAFEEILRLESTIRNGDTNEFMQPEIVKLVELWQIAAGNQNRKRSNSVVSMADQLQHAIVVVHMKRWSWQKYNLQAMAIGQEIAVPSWKTDNASDVLANPRANEKQLHSQKRGLEGMIRESNKSVRDGIEELLDDFAEVKTMVKFDGKSAWHEVRRAHAWLRSPLPTAQQRRDLLQAIEQANVQTVSKNLPDEIFNKEFLLAETKTNVTSTLDQIREQFDHDRSVISSENANPSFETRFAAALRRDPIDTSLEISDPIVHNIVPEEHTPKPTVTVRDKNNRVVDGKIDLPDRKDYFLTVELNPDSDTETKVRVRHDLRSSMVTVKWNKASSDGKIDGDEMILTIRAGDSGTIQLVVTAQHATQETKQVPINIIVEPVEPNDQTVAKLRTSRRIDLLLPRPDQIRVQVKNPLLTNHDEFVSGGGDIPDGVWLRTFVSRETSFSLSAYNDSDRPCRAKVWLIKLRHPFSGERPKISEYFAEVFASRERIEEVRGRLVDEVGQVKKRILDGNQRLEGPKIIVFGAGKTPSNISWKPEPPAEGEPTPKPAATETSESADGSIDVSHGIAFVIRLIDNNDNPMEGPDQIVWLIPKPWSPENYVDISSAKFNEGMVRLRPEIRRRIDGDNRDDSLPKVEQQSLNVLWQQDDQWKDFRSRTSDSPAVQGETSPRISVALADRGEFPIMRLGVDGWPRALRRRVDPVNGAFKEDIRWKSVRFASVTIDYGENPPSGEYDRKLEPSTTIYNPVEPDNPEAPVFFRAGGKSLTMRLHADVSPNYRRDTKLRVTEGGEVNETHRSDRKFTTTLTEIKNKGDESLIVLMTAVDDLSIKSGIEGLKDTEVVFGAEVEVIDRQGNPTIKNTTLKVHLDSTPPTASIRISRKSSGPYRVGDKVTWMIEYSDPGDVSSGVKSILFGPANDDEKPGGKPKQAINSERFVYPMTLSKVGEIKMAVQVWDGVGLASEIASRSISVDKKKPKQAMANNGKPGNAAAKPVKRGTIEGRIAINSRMRGELKLSPVPDGMIPNDGVLEIEEAKPRFRYLNVPKGEYTLTFKGYIGNSKPKPLVWEGLKIDKPKNLKRSDAK